MATKGFALTKTAWTDLGPTPCFVQLVPPERVLFVIDTVTPASLQANAHVLGAGELSADISLTGQRVFARAVGASASVVVSS